MLFLWLTVTYFARNFGKGLKHCLRFLVLLVLWFSQIKGYTSYVPKLVGSSSVRLSYTFLVIVSSPELSMKKVL